MKIVNNLFVFVLIACLGSSCKKTLEEKVYSFYSPNNLYKTEADAKSAVTGLYGTLQTWYFFKAPYLFSEDVDHDHIVGPLWNMADMGAGNYNSYYGVPNLWQGYYNISSQVNTILQKVPGITFIADSTKNRVLGEAYFFRGWSYFNLVRLWGAVPIRLENVSVGSVDLARSSVANVYAQVISDLSNAEKLLPPMNSIYSGPTGAVTQGTAKTLLAKVYLTMASSSASGTVTVRGGSDNAYYTYSKDIVAGYEGMDSKALFTKARDKAQEVINSGLYKLMPTFMGLWGRVNKNNAEMIWELQTQDNDSYGNLLQYYYCPPWYGGTGYYWMAQNLYDNYQQKDDRALNGVFHQFYMYGAWMFYPQRDSLLYNKTPAGLTAKYYASYSRPYPKKYWIGTATEIGANGTTVKTGNRDVDFPFLRYADVLLMYAEASNEASGGPSADAYAALNKVRERSNESDTSGLNQQQFRSLILEERGKEFYQENNRRFDLIRWGVFLQVMNKLGTIENVIKTRSNKNLLYPIPQSEINANKLIGANNTGW